MSQADDRYYVPHGSHWPIVGSLGLLFLMVGVSSWLNGADAGFWVMCAGVAVIVFMLVGWFGTVIGESQGGLYNDQVDKSFRMGMFWFIFSEVMFFCAFFGALFYARNMSIPWLGGESNNFFTNLLLWDGYESGWPSNGPGEVGGDYEAMGAVRLTADQYRDLVDQQHHHHDRTSRAYIWPTQNTDDVSRDDLLAWFHVCLLAGR